MTIQNHLPAKVQELFDGITSDALRQKHHDEKSHELMFVGSPGYRSFIALLAIDDPSLDHVESFAGWLLSGGGPPSQYFTWSESDFESEWNSYLENNLEVL